MILQGRAGGCVLSAWPLAGRGVRRSLPYRIEPWSWDLRRRLEKDDSQKEWLCDPWRETVVVKHAIEWQTSCRRAHAVVWGAIVRAKKDEGKEKRNGFWDPMAVRVCGAGK